MKMKKDSKLFWGMCLAIGLAIVFIGCASGPKVGATLDETLGRPLTEIQNMIGTTQAEFESLLGRKLRNAEIDEDGDFDVSGFPKSGMETLFGVKDGRVNVITIGPFNQKSYDALVEQVSVVCTAIRSDRNMPTYTGVSWPLDGIDVVLMFGSNNVYLNITKPTIIKSTNAGNE
jgi:hypothetical protein